MTTEITSSQQILKQQYSSIDQWYTESFTSLPTSHESESRRHGFFVGEIGILLPTNLNCEVTENLQVCKLPKTPHWFTGMTNLRGNIVPIFDLGILFKLPTVSIDSRVNASEKKQIFLEVDNSWVGFSSDGLPTRIMLNGSHLLETIPPAPTELEPFITRCYRHPNVWFDLNMKDLLTWIKEKF